VPLLGGRMSLEAIREGLDKIGMLPKGSSTAAEAPAKGVKAPAKGVKAPAKGVKAPAKPRPKAPARADAKASAVG
jgi:hypothetical protein